MVVGAPMWVRAGSGGNDIIGYQSHALRLGLAAGWRHNGAVVHQWVYHCYDDDTVIVSYGAGSPPACVRRRGRGAG